MSEKNVPVENKMGTMPIGKLVIRMSAPLVASMLFQALYNVVDSVFVARLSQDAMNAVSLAFPIQTLLMAFASGTGVGMNAILSNALGRKDQDGVDRAAGTGIFLAFVTMLVFTILGFFVARPYYAAQTDNQQIITYGTQYIQVCLGISIGLFGQVTVERLLQSTGRTDLAMIPQITGAVFNMIFDPILIFGLLGFPRLEVQGAAIATVCGQLLAFGIGVFLNLKYNKEIRFSFRRIRFEKHTAGEIYRIGIPSIVLQAVGAFMNFFLNSILISFTEAATAVFGAYYKIQSFIFLPVFGMNSAMVPILSYNYGARNKERIMKTIKLCILLAVGVMSFGMILFEAVPGLLLSIFSPTEEMLSVGKTAFRIIGVTFPVAGFCIVVGSVFQALGTPIYSLITSVCRQLVVLLPAAYLLSLTGKLDLVWLAFPIAEVMSAAASAFFAVRTIRNLNRTLP